MSPEVASSPQSSGGLQLPDVHVELMLLSATTVQRWLTATNTVSAAVGRSLTHQGQPRSDGPLAPARVPLRCPRLTTTIASTGLEVLRRSNTQGYDDPEREAKVLIECKSYIFDRLLRC